MTEDRFHVSYEALDTACKKWGVERVMLFGSVLRDDFSAASDIDLLVQFKPGTIHSLFKHDEMLQDFRTAFDREIDLVNYEGVLASRNERRKQHILSSAREFYVVRPQS